MNKAPDFEAIRRTPYLTKKQIQRFCHVGYRKADQIYKACEADTQSSGFELLTNRIKNTRLLRYMGVEE